MSKYGVFSGPYFLIFGLDTVIYSLSKSPYSVRIQEHRDQKNYVFGFFSRSVKIKKEKPWKQVLSQEIPHKIISSLLRLFSSEDVSSRPEAFFATLLKLHFGMSVLPFICYIFSEHLFLRTPLDSCFCSFYLMVLN